MRDKLGKTLEELYLEEEAIHNLMQNQDSEIDPSPLMANFLMRRLREIAEQRKALQEKPKLSPKKEETPNLPTYELSSSTYSGWVLVVVLIGVIIFVIAVL